MAAVAAAAAAASSYRVPTGSGSLYPTRPCPAGHRARAAAAEAGESRLRAFSRSPRGVRDGDGEGDSRSADLRGEEAAETAPEPGFAFDLDLDLRGHHAGIAPQLCPRPPPGANASGVKKGLAAAELDQLWGEREGGKRAAGGRREVGARSRRRRFALGEGDECSLARSLKWERYFFRISFFLFLLLLKK